MSKALSENPFVYGEAVGGEFFTDRERECKELKTELKSGQNLIIFSPRRYGKTSIIKKVLAELKQEGLITVYVDLFFVTSKQTFVEAFAAAIAGELTGPLNKVITTLKNLIPKLIPKIVVKGNNLPTFEFEFERANRNISPILEDLLISIQKIATQKKKRAVVVFDEFQTLLSFDDGEIEHKMRAKFQFHRKVAYVFLGSKRNLMQKLFDDQSRPFYHSGRKYPLGKISSVDFSKFIQERFEKSRIHIDGKTIALITETTQCHPYYTQELCHFVWNLCYEKNHTIPPDIETAIKEIIHAEVTHYINLWDNLTAKQKAFLIALSKQPGTSVFSEDFITGNHLGTTSSVQKTVQLLYDKQLINKNGTISFEDPFFERWIREHPTL